VENAVVREKVSAADETQPLLSLRRPAFYVQTLQLPFSSHANIASIGSEAKRKHSFAQMSPYKPHT